MWKAVLRYWKLYMVTEDLLSLMGLSFVWFPVIIFSADFIWLHIDCIQSQVDMTNIFSVHGMCLFDTCIMWHVVVVWYVVHLNMLVVLPQESWLCWCSAALLDTMSGHVLRKAVSVNVLTVDFFFPCSKNRFSFLLLIWWHLHIYRYVLWCMD